MWCWGIFAKKCAGRGVLAHCGTAFTSYQQLIRIEASPVFISPLIDGDNVSRSLLVVVHPPSRMVDVHSARGYSSTSYLQSCAFPVRTKTWKGLPFPRILALSPCFCPFRTSFLRTGHRWSQWRVCFEEKMLSARASDLLLARVWSRLLVARVQACSAQGVGRWWRSCATGPRRAEKQFLWVSGWPNTIISTVSLEMGAHHLIEVLTRLTSEEQSWFQPWREALGWSHLDSKKEDHMQPNTGTHVALVRWKVCSQGVSCKRSSDSSMRTSKMLQSVTQ